ncbi:retrovirus-related pol polyprotein from transposon TNT 1-94, partial [Tanacetum coccineum]
SKQTNPGPLFFKSQSWPLDLSWGSVGLPSGIRGLVEEGGELSLIPQATHPSLPYSPTYEAPHHPQPYQQGFQTQLSLTPPSAPQNAYHTSPMLQQPQVAFSQLDSGLAVPSFLPGDDLIACLNKAMAFMVTIQQVQGRQGQSFAGTGTTGNVTSSKGNIVTCHVKMLLVQAQESSHVLDEEQLEFLTDDLDAYDSDCDDIYSTKAVLMANLSSYDSDVLFEVVKVRTTHDAITEGSWGFEHNIKVFKEEVIPFINSLRASFKDFENGLHSELNEVKMVFNQMEAAVEQYVMNIVMHADFVPVNVLSANNKCLVNDNLEIERLEQKNDHLFELLLSQDIVYICVNSLASRNDCCEMQHDAKDVSIDNLRKHIEILKGKNVVKKDSILNKAKVIALGMFKLDLEPLSPKVLKNRDAYIDYIKHTQENADILWELVKHTKALRPLDSDLDFACKYIQRIQEVLVYITATCPNLIKPSEKLVAITSLNKNKKVRFAEPTTSSSNTQKQVDSHKTQDSNKPMLPSTGMKSSTSTSRSQPLGNTKNNRIKRTTSSNQKNKVEDHSRSTFTIARNTCPLTRITSTKVEPLKETTSKSVTTPNPEIKIYRRKTKFANSVNLRSEPSILGSRPSNISEHNKHWGSTMSNSPSSSLVNFKLSKLFSVRLNATVQNIKIDNGTEFVNQTLRAYYEDVRISHQTFVARSPQQNGVVKAQNQTLVEAARTMKPNLSYLHVFSALCYPTNDSEDLGKLKPKADIRIFIGYAPAKKAYRIYNKTTCLIIETIHVDFDELTAMASKQFSSGPGPQLLTPGTISSGLVPNHPSLTPYVLPTKKEWDTLFQPMFDEYFNTPPSVASLVPAAAASRPADPTGTPFSTIIDQDVPSPSTSEGNVFHTHYGTRERKLERECGREKTLKTHT